MMARKVSFMRVAASILLAAAALASTPASAQDGAIAGRVLDTAGGVLPGVSVQAIGSTPGEPRLEVTDLDGRYRIADLAADTYTVLFTLPGFRSVVRDGIDFGVSLAATVDAEMAIGSDDDVPVSPSVSGPHQTGAVALECTFRPDGVIAECLRAGVAGQLPRPRNR